MQCVSLFYVTVTVTVIDTGSMIRTRIRAHWPGPGQGTELGVTYLPLTFSSDAGYAIYPYPYWEPQSTSGLW